MSDRKLTEVNSIGGMVPWVCSYDGPGGERIGITLHATDPEQIVHDHSGNLPELTVDGQLIAWGNL